MERHRSKDQFKQIHQLLNSINHLSIARGVIYFDEEHE